MVEGIGLVFKLELRWVAGTRLIALRASETAWASGIALEITTLVQGGHNIEQSAYLDLPLLASRVTA